GILRVVHPQRRLAASVSDRDLRQAVRARFHAFGDAGGDCLVQDVMTCGVVTVEPDTSLTHAARLMCERRIGSLPVVEQGRLAGIVTERDLLRALIQESPARTPAV